ncbi:adenosylcobinamide-GDP ribazoletransferase [Geodermatophilus sp. YIM 151500]|uniref:adenosylcobinamide-GDP ribazoletransferase n=1 Tax=Geodermatophilus sp. YIM 151500 TaxID=2984531 RepID=UPI0021E378A6|nr:adenosylcobinamide-GDP ribazoletransferase [Geodermatophilus sp. YIM 151500]MCV2491767.1 adenosylcobinamide-GDP ribazoletransferase [Geodermatophilus sp. YIM 151500]
MRWTGPLESAALLTALPVPARAAASTRGVLPWAPLVGLVLGGVAAGVAALAVRAVSPLAAAVLGIAVLAVLTRGLHLDGLADTADGLGPLRDRDRALAVMRRGDVGPFGVVALVLVLLLQAACLAALLEEGAGWVALWVAVVAARLAMARTGLPGTPVAAGSTLGRAVEGTVSRAWLTGSGLAAAGVLLLAGLGDPGGAVRLAGSAALGLLAAELLLRRATSRLGGVNGDVIGAMGEVTTAVTLLGAAVLA